MPAHNCSYYNCTNSSEQKSMFRFPWNDVNRLKVWLENCGNMNIAHLPAENLRSRYLCIDHFNIKYVRNETGHRKRLQRNAVPEPYQTQDLQNRSSTSSPELNNSSKENGGAYDDKIGDKFLEDILQEGSQQIPGDTASQETGVLDGEDNFEEDIFEEIVDDDFHQIPGEAQPATLSAGEFSWQRASAVVPGDADDVAGAEYEMEAEMFEAPAPRARAREQSLHEGYRCNGCGGSIVGFRYVCVQCADVDLCGACEAAGQHMRHYALRVPGPRAYDEVAAVLHRVRQALLADSILLGDGLQMEAEVKEEPEEADPIAMPSDLIAMPGNPIFISMPEDPISVQAYPIAMPAAVNDGDECAIEAEVKEEPEEPDECESVGAASAAESTHALEADTAASDDDDSYAPSEDDSDSDTEAGRSAPGHTVDYSTPTRSQSHHASPSSARAVKRPAPDPICYFDLRKNAAMIAGDRSNSDMKPVTQLHSLPRHEDDTLADKRPLSAAQVLLDSKRVRVILERLDNTELFTLRVKR
ncbi:uncharacterized protein LOC126377870 isoform X1 [Pectinophora gossypiella]|uniref:uncharacterized protein LOC126377870 isoform X1 n=1 Tax=Pectinophora gossypiella TaxID=13191 RepID=UPI00214EB53F|nr:uncharacterized protein LOC126377870 isoform X1 [Pectinophora gossypiella]